MQEKKRAKLSLDSLSFGIVVVVVALLPIFFIPVLGLSLDIAKLALLQVGVVAALLFWLIARLRDGQLSIPKSAILGAVFLVPVVMFVSALFSGAIKVSMLGFSGEIGTMLSFLIFGLLLLLSALFFQDTKRVLIAYVALFVVGGVVALLEVVHFIFGPEVFSWGVFTGPTSNLIGKWNDMSIFFGFIAILSLISLQLLAVRGKIRAVLYAGLVASLFFLVVTNFVLSWVLVGVFALIVFVYALSFGRKKSETGDGNHIPLTPLLVGIVALLFLLPGNFIASTVNEQLGISQIEVRPSWSATLDLAKETIKADPVLGVGPNRFSQDWLLHKPEGVNSTLFWNTDFNFGIGLIPSFAVTTGILGVLAWLLLLISFLYFGGKALLMARSDALMKYAVSSSFLSALYFWIVAFFYVPNVVNVALAFILTGIFIGLLVKEGTVKKWEVSFLKDPRLGFISVLVIIVLIIVSVVGEYFFTQRFLAVTSFRGGVIALNNGDVNTAERKITGSLNLYEHDVYYRALSDIQISQMGNILSQGSANQDLVRSQFQTALGNAISSARGATAFDENNYLNWVSLGRVYEAVVPLGIEGAYDNADASYHKALELNPRGPSMYLVLARSELSNGNTTGAKEYITQALTLKENYTEALFLLSQIEAQAGNIKGAIAQAERASIIAPNDIGVFFQLGFLRYSDKDYRGAISALERAVQLNPVYSNAKYFLGLSYDRVGRTSDAVAQFEDIKLLNPGNKEVEQILANLRAGLDPFSNVVPPQEPPEERDELPVEEQ